MILSLINGRSLAELLDYVKNKQGATYLFGEPQDICDLLDSLPEDFPYKVSRRAWSLTSETHRILFLRNPDSFDDLRGRIAGISATNIGITVGFYKRATPRDNVNMVAYLTSKLRQPAT